MAGPVPDVPGTPETPEVQTWRSDAPWANELHATFNDPDQAQAVDGFLRSTMQPRMTQLETELSELSGAQQLMEGLLEQPGNTWYQLTEEILGEEVASKVLAALQDDEPAPPATAAVEPTAEELAAGQAAAQAALDPEDREALSYVREQRQAKQYNDALDTFLEGNSDIKKQMFHTFVAGAEGDFEVAAAGYRQWVGDFKEEFGIAPAEAEAAEAAPAVIGAGSQAPTVPPTEKHYGSIDDAIDDFFAETRPGPPTVVGST